jgi:hypothetical protein
MNETHTESLIKKLILAGPGEKKSLLKQDDKINKYFSDVILLNTPDLNDQVIVNTINDTKSLFEYDNNKEDDQIIKKIQNLMAMSPDQLIFGIEEIIESLKNNELQEIIGDSEITESIGMSPDDNCKVTVIDVDKFRKIGLDIVGIKWY